MSPNVRTALVSELSVANEALDRQQLAKMKVAFSKSEMCKYQLAIKRRRVAVNNWLLSFTLINNPQLAVLRKHRLEVGNPRRTRTVTRAHRRRVPTTSRVPSPVAPSSRSAPSRRPKSMYEENWYP